MPKVAKELGALDVKRLTIPGYHPVGGVAGLSLQVAKPKLSGTGEEEAGSRSWVLKIKVGTKRREIGLGAYPGVTLAFARANAQEIRDGLKRGIDPVIKRIEARQNIISNQIKEKALAWTFRRCATAYILSMSPGWSNAKHAKQWTSTLQTYVYPAIGDMLVSRIKFENVLAIVEPHWTTKNETINRVRNRIELVLDWATVRRYREGDNPARWKGNLDKQLAARSVVAPTVSHRALAADAMHGFMMQLRTIQTTAARCLEFAILNVSRSGEARLATWAEVDFKTRTWTIPAVRMKAKREQRVPLSDQSVKLLQSLPRMDSEILIFPGRKSQMPLSDMTLTKLMRNMAADGVPHGFRSTFSSWVASSTTYPAEVREMALAHAIGSDTVGAYQRSDLFEKRRNLMKDWANFIEAMPSEGDNVINFRNVDAA